ncbi:MAG: oxaloacetate decarboxylase, partial [Bacteroidales bacterium]|nr:oxaloacetate decarboxylase [Bacteroidales bacterium]
PKLGYPPLVTPFSQYVKNIALMNIYAMSAGQPRFSMIDKDSWNMILGRMGKLPGELAPEIVELAKSKGYEFFTGNPQDEYPDALETYRQEMQTKGWDCGQDDEELFELAMHDRQYRDYKSGIAKKRFNEELEVVKHKENKVIQVEDDKDPKIKKIKAPETGRLLFAFISDQYKVGDQIPINEQLFYIESNTNYEVVISEYAGTVGKLYCKQGDWVHEGDTIMTIVTE